MIAGNIRIEEREDGGIRVSSPDWPGLLLSGTDHAKVMSCVLPAIIALEAHRATKIGLGGVCRHNVSLQEPCLSCDTENSRGPNFQRPTFGN